MNDSLKRAQSLVGYSSGRPEHDFYATPRNATLSLLEKVKFEGDIWEPACGDGAISKVLKEKGYVTYSTDLIYRDYGYGDIDFLKTNYKFNNIITNPPYKLAQQFVEHSLECTDKKVAMLCKLQFLESETRKKLFENTPLKNVLVFSKRLTMYRNNVKMKNSGMIAFAWFVWDHEYKGEPTISWV